MINGPLDVKNKKDSPIRKLGAKKGDSLRVTKSNLVRTKRNSDEQLKRDERMDVDKVTLEDDENGDQNLDKDAAGENDKDAAGENDKDDEQPAVVDGDEEGKEDHEILEERLPNIMGGNE